MTVGVYNSEVGEVCDCDCDWQRISDINSIMERAHIWILSSFSNRSEQPYLGKANMFIRLNKETIHRKANNAYCIKTKLEEELTNKIFPTILEMPNLLIKFVHTKICKSAPVLETIWISSYWTQAKQPELSSLPKATCHATFSNLNLFSKYKKKNNIVKTGPKRKNCLIPKFYGKCVNRNEKKQIDNFWSNSNNWGKTIQGGIAIDKIDILSRLLRCRWDNWLCQSS